MAGKRIYGPSILINAVEYKCFANTVSLEPSGTYVTFCEQDWNFTASIQLGYSATDTWNLLNALADTVVTIVLLPEQGTAVSATNPSATFTMRMPSPAFMTSTTRGDYQVFDLTGRTESAPVTAVA